MGSHAEHGNQKISQAVSRTPRAGCALPTLRRGNAYIEAAYASEFRQCCVELVLYAFFVFQKVDGLQAVDFRIKQETA
jgi:hypothetical protein